MEIRLLPLMGMTMMLLITTTVITGCAQPAPTLIPVNSPDTLIPSPTSTVDTPAYKESAIIGIANNQPEVKSLYAVAETTRDYKYPEIKDFKWTAQYLGTGRWYVRLDYTQWSYDLNGYITQTKSWFFEESKGALTPAG
jgi:hypothetical protein